MTTPAQQDAGSDLEKWFDAAIRPALLECLGNIDALSAALASKRHKAAIDAIRHWLGELQPAADWSSETRQVVAAIAGELRGLLGD